MCKRYCCPPELPLVTCFLELAVARRVDLGLSSGEHLELAVARRVDLGLSSGEHIVRRHVADGTVQAYGVVVLHVSLNQTNASSLVSGVPGRMHSDFSDLCQRSSLPFDCG